MRPQEYPLDVQCCLILKSSAIGLPVSSSIQVSVGCWYRTVQAQSRASDSLAYDTGWAKTSSCPARVHFTTYGLTASWLDLSAGKAGAGLVRRYSGVLLRPRDELGQRHDTGGPGDFPAVQDQRKRWNASHRETRGDIRCGLGIDFCQPDMRLKPLRRLLDDRRHHAARTAPGGPEVDQERDVAPLGVLGRSGSGRSGAGDAPRTAADGRRRIFRQRPAAHAVPGWSCRSGGRRRAALRTFHPPRGAAGLLMEQPAFRQRFV
ncbi:protein of unknown function (plasmid) [Azospirillum baldaniorum]|uniref:Uncharacterized protein n=1 Tax=Azospirillum baldaniorum TaxID=1064539 RepID=A0A9P1JV13_9PROT|nr:protein of unknown function [Azospirillum baldaniorum]